MRARLLRRVTAPGHAVVQALRRRLAATTKPATTRLVAGALTDLVRDKPELIAENALLRHQLLVLRRRVTRPRCSPADRALLVLLASRARAWRQALLLVQPDTLLRWHRQLFRGFWPRESRAAVSARQPKVSAETIALIREMAAANRRWGAERIRGELLQLDVRVAKWTVQQYMRAARPARRAGQSWATFLKNHADDTWACDFLPVTDALFRPVYAFFIIALGTRRVVHAGVTRHPTDAWVAQQLREATPFDQRPTYLIRDNDRKYGRTFAQLAEARGITELRMAYRAPRQNATGARFLGSVRRECLDHVLILGAAHLRRVLREYATYINTVRPHQGLQQRIPEATTAIRILRSEPGRAVRAVPVLGGLHHTYQHAG